jgi:hypothetical protein
MAKYNNLPGVTLELLDGNIASLNELRQPIALVVGRSYSGPIRTQLVLDDNAAASKRFGQGSPLIAAAQRIKSGGIPTVLVYRIGGGEAVLEDFAGAGSILRTTEASVSAASNLRIYVGPSQADPAVKVCQVFFGTTGNKIVYSNVPGSLVDLGYVIVTNFDNTTTNVIGSPSDPVLLSSVATAGVYESGTSTETIAAGVGTWTLPATTTANFRSVTSVTLNGAAITTGFSTAISGSDIEFTVATPVDDDVYVVTYEKTTPLAGATFTNGDDGMSATKNQYYEMVDAALRDVEGTVAQYLYVEGAKLDEDNVADGSTATDKLEYLNLVEIDGEFSYEWGTDKTVYKLGAGTTTDATLADVDLQSQPIVAKRFNEVNFAHRLGQHAQSVAENDGFILVAVDTKAPETLAVRDISKFVGVTPVVDPTSGYIISNGSGLLGNKFMSGTTTRDKGFFATDSGFPDGTPLVDAGGAKIDLGKFLNVVPQFVNSGGAVVSGAANYLGLIGSTTIGDSTTNRLVENVTLPYSVKKSKLDELSGAGYVCFAAKTDGVRVVSGELATSNESDYQYVSTSLIIQSIIGKIRTAADKYIGKGMTQVLLQALKTNIDTILRAEAAALTIENSNFDVIVTGPGQITIPLVIVPAFELRQIYIPISLSI